MAPDARETKFYPPRLNPALHLERDLARSILATGLPKATVLAAQAGQGKSTLAAQLVAGWSGPWAWYQLGPEDRDPVFFLETLLPCLSRRLEGFAAPVLSKMLAAGEARAAEWAGLADLLTEGLRTSLRGEFLFAFDDVHAVEGAAATAGMIGSLFRSPPTGLRLLLLSRRPVPGLDGASPRKAFRLGNADLAFSAAETGELLVGIHKLSLTATAVRDLHRATEGWVMGITLAVGRLKKGGVGHSPAALDFRPSALPYFATEVLDHFPEDVGRALLRLALLSEVPADLAQKLSLLPDARDELRALARSNFFVRALDDAEETFSFHPLFRECLAQRAEEELTAQQRGETLRQAGAWYRAARRWDPAIPYFLAARDLANAEAGVREVALELYGRNRITWLKEPLDALPPDALQGHPWLGLFRALAYVNTSPLEALPDLERARRGFVAAGDEVGELLCSVELVRYHFGVDALFRLGRPYLLRAAELLERLEPDLPVLVLAHVASWVGLGFVLLEGDFQAADRHSSRALRWALESDLENLLAGARIALGYQFLMAADLESCRQEVNASIPLLTSPRVSSLQRGGLWLLQLGLLAFEGDFFSYECHRDLLIQAVGKDYVAESVLGAFVRLWDVDAAVGQSRYPESRRLLAEALAAPHAAASPHLRSQYLEYSALLLAIEGEEAGAREAAEESRRLRRSAGGRYFEAQNDAILGAAYTVLEDPEEAEAALARAIDWFEAAGEGRIRAGAHLHRALARLRNDAGEDALEDLRCGLGLLRLGGHLHFNGCTPGVLKDVLSAAVVHRVEVSWAKELAAERLGTAMLPDGTHVPLLHLRALGPLELEVEGHMTLRASDFTPSQRRLLALLVSSEHLARTEEQIQTDLWPEGAPGKARASFDALVSRLRKVLDARVGARGNRRYLSVRKGVVSLTNCRTDVWEFREMAREGIRLAADRKPWQATIALRKAERLWRGVFAPGIPLDESGEGLYHDLWHLCGDVARTLAALLAERKETEEALAVGRRALAHDPSDERAVQIVYDLCIKKGDVPAANRFLRRYEAALRREGCPPSGVQMIMEAFWNRPT